MRFHVEDIMKPIKVVAGKQLFERALILFYHESCNEIKLSFAPVLADFVFCFLFTHPNLFYVLTVTLLLIIEKFLRVKFVYKSFNIHHHIALYHRDCRLHIERLVEQ